VVNQFLKKYLLSPFAQKEKGVLAIEGAITFPLIIILLFGTVDIGMLAERYFTLSRVVYEGARIGASLGGLSNGKFNRKCPTTSTSTSLGYTCDTNVQVFHVELQTKILLLLEENGFTDLGQVNLTTERIAQTAAQMDSNVVNIQIRLPIPLITSIVGESVSLSVSSSSPYLFRS